NITSTQTITPGSYGDITLGGNQTVTFSGTGTYVFNTIKNTGAVNTFVFDFQNKSTPATFTIYVYGDVDLNQIHVNIKNNGDASRIFMETHGTGVSSSYGSYAWNMNNSSQKGQYSQWFGTVWAPYAGIRVGSDGYLGSSNIKGALWSGTQV